jgi:hypothetical protein
MKRRNSQLRGQIAQEAARLMYEEGVKEYFVAKRMAAKRVLGKNSGGKQGRSPGGLPSNGEIQAALLEVASLAEGDSRTRRLALMRLAALSAMQALELFSARLIGSVSTGHVRHGSDIDIQLFGDDVDVLREHLYTLGWCYEEKQVTISKFGEFREYLHFYVDDVFDLELTIYPSRELRFVPRSSTDGKPIRRLKAKDLEALIDREHPSELREYLESGLHSMVVGGEFDTAESWLDTAESWLDTAPPKLFSSLVSTEADDP